MKTPGTVLMTINVVGLGPEERETPPASLFGRFAHGRYTYNVGLDRLLAFLRLNDIPATFFWPVLEATRARALLDRCLDDGHEVASHGYAFEAIAQLGAGEYDYLARAKHELERLIGAQVTGFRAPDGLMSAATVSLLERLAYVYDSSFLDDDAPYSLISDGAPGMVELPWNEACSDTTHFRRRFTQNRALSVMRAEFDGLMAADGYACLSLSPRGDVGVGRAARLDMLQTLVEHMRTAGAVFRRCTDVAAACRDRDGVNWNGTRRELQDWHW